MADMGQDVVDSALSRISLVRQMVGHALGMLRHVEGRYVAELDREREMGKHLGVHEAPLTR